MEQHYHWEAREFLGEEGEVKATVEVKLGKDEEQVAPEQLRGEDEEEEEELNLNLIEALSLS